MDRSHDYIFKMIIIGDSGVGKTSLMTRFTDKQYNETLSSTIGVDFKIKTIDLGNAKIKLQIWDTAGQERFRAVVSNYYRGANGIFIVFDLQNRNSFLHLNEWFDELKKKSALETAEVMVLGNKVDCSEERKVTVEEIANFLSSNEIPKNNYVEVSAKENVKVEESFIELARKLVTKFGTRNIKQPSKSSLTARNSQTRRGCC